MFRCLPFVYDVWGTQNSHGKYTRRSLSTGAQTRGRYDTKDGSCYADFSTTTMDTRPFGPNGMYTWTDGLFGLSVS